MTMTLKIRVRTPDGYTLIPVTGVFQRGKLVVPDIGYLNMVPDTDPIDMIRQALPRLD